MTKNKFLFLSITIIIFVLVIIITLAFYFLKNNGSEVNIDQSQKESSASLDLKEANREAIKKAQQFSGSEIGDILTIKEDDHIWGDASALVQIIMYEDFECLFCAQFFDIVERIKQEFSEQVVIAFRHYPLSSNPNAFTAALASECAAEQGKFWEMHDELFSDNKNGIMGIKQFEEDAAAIGLDKIEFNQCLEEEKYKEKVLADIVSAKKAGVIGTPTTFVNKEFVIGARPFEDFISSDGKEREGMKNIILRHLAEN